MIVFHSRLIFVALPGIWGWNIASHSTKLGGGFISNRLKPPPSKSFTTITFCPSLTYKRYGHEGTWMYDSLVTMEWAIFQGLLRQLHAVMVEIGVFVGFQVSQGWTFQKDPNNMMFEGPGWCSPSTFRVDSPFCVFQVICQFGINTNTHFSMGGPCVTCVTGKVLERCHLQDWHWRTYYDLRWQLATGCLTRDAWLFAVVFGIC